MLLTSITRYPIKGLAGELLTDVAVKRGETLPGDRRHALQFCDRMPPDPINWRPKKYFLQSTQPISVQIFKYSGRLTMSFLVIPIKH